MRQGDVLSPVMFKLYINDLPKYLQRPPDEVLLNGISVQYLMYADNIVLLSSSRERLQSKLNTLHKFCDNWCLDVNIRKIKTLVFKQPDRLLKDTLCLNQ